MSGTASLLGGAMLATASMTPLGMMNMGANGARQIGRTITAAKSDKDKSKNNPTEES
jgi:hypothetical protein